MTSLTAQSKPATKPQYTLLILHVVVCFSLLATAAIIGTLSYYFLRHEETLLFEAQYKSITEEALERAVDLVGRQGSAGQTVASIYRNYNPELSSWPNVTIPGFVGTSTKLKALSGIYSFAFAPILQPEEVSSFEAFALQYLQSDPKIANTTGHHDFGFGIFEIDANSPYPDKKVHYTSGNTTYDSPYQVIVPILQHPSLYGPQSSAQALTLLNWRIDENRGRTIDAVITCTRESPTPQQCGVVTDFIELATTGEPSMLLYYPVFAANDKNYTIVGVIGTVVTFESLFQGGVANYVSGIYAVLSTDTSAYTYIIKKGEAKFVGIGDRHDPKYNEYREREYLTSSNMADASRVYMLEFYPTDEYVSYYHTNRPLIISLTSAAIIIFTSLVFLIYDYFMKKVSDEQLELLEAKRKFVRFISHEVRTPLNTISLGAKLLNMQLHKMMSECPQSDYVVEITDCIELSEELLDGTDSAVMALNDMIRYDEIDIGVLRLDATLIPIIDLLRTVKKSYDIVAREKQIEYLMCVGETSSRRKKDVDSRCDDSYRVIGDEMQLLHVFRNLLSNAFNHTDIRGTIRLEYEWIADGLAANVKSAFSEDDTCKYPRAGSILISVIDTGVGMSPEQLLSYTKECSNPLPKSKSVYPITELGIKAAREIVDRHSGVLKVASAGVGRGCTFTVELPVFSVAMERSRPKPAQNAQHPFISANSSRIAPTVASQLTKYDSAVSIPTIPIPIANGGADMNTNRSEQRPEPSLASPLRVAAEPVIQSKNVLVVDDAPSTRKILCRLLRNNGHTCSEADNGAKAVSAYIYCDENSPFDAILMDYEMPVMNGPTATRILRSLGFTNPIIGITGNVLPEDVSFFKSNGANAVLAKPLKVPELEAIWNDAQVGYAVTTPELEDTGVYRQILSEKVAVAKSTVEVIDV